MFCENCGNKTKEDSKFCTKCGEHTSVHSPNDQKEKNIGIQTKKTGNVLDQVVTVGSIIVGFILGKYLGLAIFIFIFALLIGQWFPKWYLKREKINITLVKWIVWSNVITWFLPPLGIMTGFATLEFGNHFPKEKKKYKILAIIGIVLALINAFWGMLINI